MALQTKVYSKTSNTFTLELTLVENSTSTAGNTSSVSYTLKLKSTTKNFAQYGVGAEVKLDNRSVAFRDRWNAPKITLGTYSEVTLLSGTATVGHNNDGSKSMSFVYSMDMSAASYTPGPMNGYGSMALSTIPREAKLTSAPNFTDEDNPTIQYSNPAGANIYAYLEVNGIHPAEIRQVYGSSYTFRLTDAERNLLRQATLTSNTTTIRFVLRTDIGTTPYYSWLDRTLTIKNPSPILNPTVSDINPDTIALTGDSGNLVKFHSNLAVKTGAKAVKGATLVRQSITCGSLTLTGDGTLKGVESGTIVISATDSRGNTTTKTINRKLVGYVRLSCNLGDGAPDASGQYNLEITGACYYGNFGKVANTLNVKYRYRKKGADSWGEWTDVDSVLPVGFTYLARAKVEGLDYQTAYEFQAMAADQLETVTSTERTVKSLPTFDWSGTDFNFNVPVTVQGHGLSRCGATASMTVGAGIISGEKEISLGKMVNSYGGAELSSGGIKVPNAGMYLISGAIHYTGGATNAWCAVGVVVGGKAYSASYSALPNGSGSVHSHSLVVPASAGDVIKLKAYADGGGISANREDRTMLTVVQIF